MSHLQNFVQIWQITQIDSVCMTWKTIISPKILRKRLFEKTSDQILNFYCQMTISLCRLCAQILATLMLWTKWVSQKWAVFVINECFHAKLDCCQKSQRIQMFFKKVISSVIWFGNSEYYIRGKAECERKGLKLEWREEKKESSGRGLE